MIYCLFIYLRRNLLLNFSISARIGEKNIFYCISYISFGRHFAKTPSCSLYTFYGIRRFASFSLKPKDLFQDRPKWFFF